MSCLWAERTWAAWAEAVARFLKRLADEPTA